MECFIGINRCKVDKPRPIRLRVANRYANLLSLITWLTIGAVIISTKMAGFVLTLLFTLFAFTFTEELMNRCAWKNRIFSTVVAIIIIVFLGIGLYFSVRMLTSDLLVLLQESEPLIAESLMRLGLDETMLQDINRLYGYAGEFLQENLVLLSNFGSVLLNVVLGVVFGVLLFYHDTNKYGKYRNIWTLTEYKINYFARLMFCSFKTIMGTQVLIAIMNTMMITVYSLLITPMFFSSFLPYYYIIIPLVFLFSLIPVVGNLIVNFLIIIASLQLSLYYSIAGIIYFFIAHKLELLIVGRILHLRMEVPFVLILFSMVLGELVFRSFAGIILGMVLLFSILSLLKSFETRPIKNHPNRLRFSHFPF